MDEKLLIETQKKRFQQILEYTNFGAKYSTLDEDNEENSQDDAMPQPQDTQEPPMNPGSDAMGQQDGGQMPADDGMGMEPQQPMGGGMDMGGAGNGQPQGNQPAQTPQGFNPQEIPSDGDVSVNDFEGGVSEDDDVVDISDLTDAQEDTEKEIKEIGSKFNDVLKYIGKFEEMLNSNNEKIENLKSEFEKRNPTQVEKLSMQTAHSYPFSETPEEYWKKKEATSNYSTEDDENGVGQEQYTITKHDIDSANDWRSISKSLDDENNPIFHPTLKNTLGI